MVNLYNTKTEKEQIDVLNNMFVLSEKFDTDPKKQLIMAGDFNLFFDSKLDAQSGNPTIKKKKKIMTVIYGEQEIQNLNGLLLLTFAQKHSSGFIQHRLDYMYISNTIQELVSMTEVLTPISTDHAPVLFSLSNEKGCLRGKGIWKFNNSLRLVSTIFYRVFYFSPNDSPSKTMKNVFYFI